MKLQGYYINTNKRIMMAQKFEEFKIDNPEFENIKQNIFSHKSCTSYGSTSGHTATLTNCYYKRDLPIRSKEYRNCSFKIFTNIMYDYLVYEPYYFICEDNFYIINREYFENFMRDFNNIKHSTEWDVILVSHFGNNNYSFDNDILNKNNFLRNKKNTNTTAYIVKQSMLINLINTFERAMNDPDYLYDINIFSFKNYWTDLQDKYKFYIYNRSFASMRPYIEDKFFYTIK
jgi:hypothetical protein